MDSVAPLLIITALILLNGLFVAAEFAIVGAPRAAIERRAARGSRTAQLVRHIVSDPRRQDRFIATAQLGITAASLGLGMYGEHVVAGWIAGHLEAWGTGGCLAAHAVASAIAITVLTYFHIVVGEMVPKSLALQRAQQTVLWIAPIMRAIQFAFYPLVVLLNGLGNGILRLFGINRQLGSTEYYRTPEELAYIVRESQAGGLLRKESAQVVNELLEFGDLTAGEVMVPRVRVAAIRLGADTQEIQSMFSTRPHTRYPVYEGTLDSVVGMVHVKDLIRLLPRQVRLSAENVRAVPFVPQAVRMEGVLSAMRQSRSQMAIVMDEHGGTAGLITIEDLFEELVGELSEDSSARPSMYRDDSGRLHIAGTLRFDDIGEALGTVLDHSEVDTVSGLVLTQLGRPPVVGDVVVYQRVRFEVVAVEGHGVAECVASVLELPATEPE